MNASSVHIVYWASLTHTNTMATPFDLMLHNMKLEGQKVLGFGKYYGKTYQDVYMNDYSYCMWCMSKDPNTFSMYDFQSYIKKVKRLT